MYVQSNYSNYAPISISNTVRAVIIYQADTVNSRFLMSLLEAFWRCTRRGSSSTEASGKADFVFMT